MCEKANIDYVNLVDTNVDIPLSTRTAQANEIYRNTDKPCIYISIHANGFSDESANGWEVYTSVGETKSDEIANILYCKAEAEFPTHKMRKDTRDGDYDKESNFYVLKNTAMPAILSENFFMTNEAECRLLMSDVGRDRIAKIHFEMIQELEK
jgi:N-acetylmuramoyl-L-alanine amidase